MLDQHRRPFTEQETVCIRHWATALCNRRDPKEAADELYRLGVRTRGGLFPAGQSQGRDVRSSRISPRSYAVVEPVRARGSAWQAATCRLPEESQQEKILRHLRDNPGKELRGAIVATLAEMGGAESVPVLASLAQEDLSHKVRAAAVDALGIIGGPEAMQALEMVANNDSDHRVREIAASARAELSE